MNQRANRVIWVLATILIQTAVPGAALANPAPGELSVTALDTLGRTPLMLAALDNDTESVKAFLAEGAEVNARDKNGMTALMWATPEVTPLLIQSGADIHARDNRGRAALDYAVYQGFGSAVRLLIACGADPNAGDSGHSGPLFWAVDHFLISLSMFPRTGERVSVSGDLYRARKRLEGTGLVSPMSEVISVLISGGANPNQRDSDGCTPLIGYLETCPMPAILFSVAPDGRWRWDNTEPLLIVDELLAKGAAINAQDKEGNSALSWAANLPDGVLVKHLLQHGANPNTQVIQRIVRLALVSKNVRTLLQEAASARDIGKPQQR